MSAAEPQATPQSELVEPTRVKTFASFFKGYMGLGSVVTAALPIPVTALNLIPSYKVYTPILSTYTSLFCFLLLGYVFYMRHRLARLYFGEAPTFAPKKGMAALPAGLIVLSFAFVLLYHLQLKASLLEYQRMTGAAGDIGHSEYMLAKADYKDIPMALELMLLYLGIFLSAELAFIMMATREYLQDVIRIPERTLFGGVGALPKPEMARCIVFFNSVPRGGQVYIDGESAGQTPCSAKVTAGAHDIESSTGTLGSMTGKAPWRSSKARRPGPSK